MPSSGERPSAGSAVRVWARSELAGRWRALVALGVITGLAAGLEDVERAFVAGLIARGEAAPPDEHGNLPPGATHEQVFAQVASEVEMNPPDIAGIVRVAGEHGATFV